MNVDSINVVIILNDYTKMGGVEKVTANLSELFINSNSNFNFQGVISLNKEFNDPKIKYSSKISIFVMKVEEIKYFIKEKKITHVIIQSQVLKETLDILKELDGLGVKKFPVLHNTPHVYLKFFYKKNNLMGFIKYLKMIFVTRQINLFLFKEVIRRSKKFLLVSKKAEEELKIILPVKYHNKISFIYNAQDVPIKNYSDCSKENLIVYSGRLAYDKQVLKAVKLLVPTLKKNSNWRLEILGDGPEGNMIKKYLLDNNVKNIFLKGRVDNVFEYLSRSKISFLYSLYEGLPTSMLEAAFCENVLIASNSSGGVTDIVKNNINGFIVESDIDFIDKIESLIINDNLIYSLRVGNHSVLKNFNNNEILELWKKLFYS